MIGEMTYMQDIRTIVLGVTLVLSLLFGISCSEESLAFNVEMQFVNSMKETINVSIKGDRLTLATNEASPIYIDVYETFDSEFRPIDQPQQSYGIRMVSDSCTVYFTTLTEELINYEEEVLGSGLKTIYRYTYFFSEMDLINPRTICDD